MDISWGDHNVRASAVWRSLYTRDSTYDADAIFSMMGLLGVTVDPTEVPRSHYYLASMIKLAHLYLSSGGRTYWMWLYEQEGGYRRERGDTITWSYDDRMCAFMRPDPEAIGNNSASGHVDPVAPVVGRLDDKGDLHVRTSALYIPARLWQPKTSVARSNDDPFDIWLINLQGVDEGAHLELSGSSPRQGYLALARHGRARWHIFCNGSHIRLTDPMNQHFQISDPVDQLGRPTDPVDQRIRLTDPMDGAIIVEWQYIDMCIGGPNPVHDLFTKAQQPWQEVNCVFRDSLPVLLPIARRRPLGGGNQEDRSPANLTAEELEQVAVYERDIPYEDLTSKPHKDFFSTPTPKRAKWENLWERRTRSSCDAKGEAVVGYGSPP